MATLPTELKYPRNPDYSDYGKTGVTTWTNTLTGEKWTCFGCCFIDNDKTQECFYIWKKVPASVGATGPRIEEMYDADTDSTTAAIYGYTEIINYMFYGNKYLSAISMPDDVTSIGKNAFYSCINLALASLPSGLTSIGEQAFYYCKRLSVTSLPSGITNIEKKAFQGCTNLALTSLPSGVTSIKDCAFYNCTNLALTSLPSGLTSIVSYAFQNCTGLTSITFESTPTSIGSYAFDGCTNLTSIKVPWAEGVVANAPWGAKNATITYNYTGEGE